jgi:superfamily I DNA/RNA helicase
MNPPATIKTNPSTLRKLRAATAGEGPVLTIAGAGTGKTKTLAARMAWLVSQGIDPGRIMLLTFTRRASDEAICLRVGRNNYPQALATPHKSAHRAQNRCARTALDRF